VAGTATEAGAYVTNVTVSGTGLSSGPGNVYADGTWDRSGATLANGTNTYTATAQDTYGRQDTSTVTVNLPLTNTFAYDLNGNLLTDGTRSFSYDDENELSSVWVTNVWRSDFAYDGLMRRRIRREYLWQSGTWTLQSEIHYVYDGNLVVQERWFGASSAGLIAQDTITYTRGSDLSGTLQGAGGIGGLLARTDNGQLTGELSSAHAYYHCDGNGNVTALVDTNGVILARYTYDPYGNVLSMSGPLATANLYRFSSKEWHPNSGLVYYGHRFYDPNVQRWLNRDPLGVLGGINLYCSMFNSPNGIYDPLGLCDAGKIAAGAVQVAGAVIATAALLAAEAPSGGLTTLALPNIFLGITHGMLEIGAGLSDNPNDPALNHVLQSYPSNVGGVAGYLVAGPSGTQVGNMVGDVANLSVGMGGLFSDVANAENLGLPLAEVTAASAETGVGYSDLAETLGNSSGNGPGGQSSGGQPESPSVSSPGFPPIPYSLSNENAPACSQ